MTYWSYSDALIQTYTLPYVRMIRKVIPAEKTIYLVTLEKDRDLRKASAERSQEDNLQWIPLNYHPFGWKSFFFWGITGFRLYMMILKKRISYIHCWGTPAGAIGYILSGLTGRKLILDSYEPHAEAMVENGTWPQNGFAFRLLFWLEKKQTRRASFIISATEGMRHYAKEKYGIELTNLWSKPAGVDLDLFGLDKVKLPDIMKSLGLRAEHVVCVYAGKFGGIYLSQEVFDFFCVAARYWKDIFKVVLLTNSPKAEIDAYCLQSGLDPETLIIKFVPHHEIPAYLGLADFAITPVKPVPSKRFCTPIKNGEYWALGLPVVIPANISDDSAIIERNEIGAVLYELNQNAYVDAVRKIDTLIKNPSLRTKIRMVATQYRSFSQAEKIYKKIYAP